MRNTKTVGVIIIFSLVVGLVFAGAGWVAGHTVFDAPDLWWHAGLGAQASFLLFFLIAGAVGAAGNPLEGDDRFTEQDEQWLKEHRVKAD